MVLISIVITVQVCIAIRRDYRDFRDRRNLPPLISLPSLMSL